MPLPTSRLIPACLIVIVSLGTASVPASGPEIPLVAGMRVVVAVNDSTSPAEKGSGILQGDYEMVVTIAAVDAGRITLTAFLDGSDETGARRRASITRVVSAADLATARVQIFGFHTDDPPRIDGTTSLGPSLDIIRELGQTGTAAYSFRNFASRETVSGMLRRSSVSPVKFPVLLNGKRVELDAIHATGQMALGAARRPFETVLLNHPQHPLSLRIAYGPRDGGFPFTPAFAREIVRIDFPTKETSLAEAIKTDCRAEVPGIYFDFNRATLKPESRGALEQIAAVLRGAPGRGFTVEGHTDNIGSDRYNDSLSAERAAAVKTALVRDLGVDAARLSTIGYGEGRPIESNDTLAGRARNRRVELVCASGK